MNAKELPMPKLELGTLSMTVRVKDHEAVSGYPRLNVEQDNLKEALPQIPDGTYRWVLVMDLERAERIDED
jgi:hypothetical protein